MRRRSFLAAMAAAAAAVTTRVRRKPEPQVTYMQLDEQYKTWSANDSNYGRMTVAA